MSSNRKQVAVENILLAAERCFGQLGPAGTSIQRIATQAGMSKQALMHHFPTKQQLIDAVWERVVERAKRFQPALLRSLMLEDSMRELEALIDEFSVNPYWAQFLLRELVDKGPLGIPDELRIGQEQMTETLNSLVSSSGIDLEAALVNLNLSLLVSLATSIHEDEDTQMGSGLSVGLSRRLESIRQLYGLLQVRLEND